MVKLQKKPPPGYLDNSNPPVSFTTVSDPDHTYSRDDSASTALTEYSTTTSASPSSHASGQACSFNTNVWSNDSHDDELSDELPSRYELDMVGDIPIYDAEGTSRSFKSLYSGEDAIGERQFVVFIRHFYCGACQAYLKALTRSIDPHTYFGMNTPTSIVIIGCGSPSLISHYKAHTGTDFPIFAEPTRKLYEGLGMGWSLNFGSERPEYMKDISVPTWLVGQVKHMQQVQGLRMKLSGGNPFQVGGEFLFANDRPIWCHRMLHYRNHAEVDVVRKVLEID